MTHAHHQESQGNNGESWLFSRTGVATLVAVSVLGFLIYTGHGAHLLGYLPYLLILLCPLMHIFMHGGHGGHGGHGSHRDEEEEETSRRPEPQQQTANAPQAAGTQKPGQQGKQHKHGEC